MKLFIVMFLMNYNKIRTTSKIHFELGNNYDIQRKNVTVLEKKNSKYNHDINNDAALMPLKDMPKHKPLW
mgnify:CR=1 FL=1